MISLTALNKKIALVEKHPLIIGKAKVSDEILELRAKYENSLYDFAKVMWSIVDPNPWVDTWHLHALSEFFTAIYNMEIRDAVINMPFRSGKSIMKIMFEAWIIAKQPSIRIMDCSYSKDLEMKHHISCRNIIASPLYQKIWGDKFYIKKDRDNQSYFETNKLGFRQASTIGGLNTGSGSDILLVDDPQKVMDVRSPTLRNKVTNWYFETMSSRFTTANTFRRIVIQQRLHELDLTGEILSRELNYQHFRLPMEFEKERRCVIPPLNWSDPRQEEGELLCPNLVSREVVEQKKKELGAYAASGQLQQLPSPAAGGILLKQWFQLYKHNTMPEMEYILQSWDTALSIDENAAYSACTTWGVFEHKFSDGSIIPMVMFMSMWKGRLETPDLRKLMIRMSKNIYDTDLENPLYTKYPADLVVIEAKQNGDPLVHDLRRCGVNAIGFNPPRLKEVNKEEKTQAKVKRARLISPYLECGKVWLPTLPNNPNKLYPDAEEFREACAMFPNNAYNDVVDSMTQALLKLTESGMITMPDELPSNLYQNYKGETKFYQF